MNLKHAIGNRITQSRKALEISIKELAVRTGSLSAQRISNYEQGIRSPGPAEATFLAQQLNVSASYLLCLTNNPQGEFSDCLVNRPRQIPVLSLRDAVHAKEIIGTEVLLNHEQLITIDNFNASKNDQTLFAVRIEDKSMEPDFSETDLIVVASEQLPTPGDFVLAYLPAKKQTVLRKYRETENDLFQLLANNELWVTINVKGDKDAVLLGIVTEHRRFLK